MVPILESILGLNAFHPGTNGLGCFTSLLMCRQIPPFSTFLEALIKAKRLQFIMAASDLLQRLPPDISHHVLGTWIEMREIVRLCCVRRHFVRTFIQSEGFVFHNVVELTPIMLTFLLKSRMRISRLELEAEYTCTGQLSRYFREFGRFVKSVDFSGSQQDSTLACVALYCKNLVELHACDVAFTSTFADILWQNPTLQVMRLVDVPCADSDALHGLHLDKLTQMVLVRCLRMDNNAWLQNISCESLRCVDFSDNRLGKADLLALLQNCPHIQTLGLRATNLTNKLLQQVVELRPGIRHIDVSENNELTDAGMLCVVQNLARLCFLNCRRCPNITVASLSYISEHRGQSLQVLYIDGLNRNSRDAARQASLRAFAQHATALHTFGASGDDFNSTIIACCLAQSCTALRRLVVTDYQKISAGVCAFLNHLRPEVAIQNGGNVKNVIELPL